MQPNNRAVIGGNRPPSPIDTSFEAIADLGRFLVDNPVILDGKQATEGTLYVERLRKTFADQEADRIAKTRPLNDELDRINDEYKSVHNTDKKKPGVGDKVLAVLRERLTDYTAREEAKRIRAAEEARLHAEALEMVARRAEEAEREIKENATQGEIVDVAHAVIAADQAFSAMQKGERAAAVAERDTVVRLPSQLGGKALSMRTKEVLTVDNALRAISEIGSNEKINEAIVTAARDYRRTYGRLPAGVSASTTRSI